VTAEQTLRSSQYVHPRSCADSGQSDYSLDIADEPKSNYVKWIADLCAPHLGPSVLDVGAGHGAVTSHFAGDRNVTALDISPACAAALRARFIDTPQVRVVEGDLQAVEGKHYHSIILINVLEHIHDDSGFLALLARHLTPGGKILIYVPALNGLYTAWDRKVGHYRRYSKRRLAGVAAEADLTVTELQYVNLLAIPAWLVSGTLVDRPQRTIRSLSIWDRFAVPICRFVETWISPPLGLNLFCVLQQRGASPT
jgi:2-polyprenyl-3-methyl-5-hydroxy-6-metoxy-1,4-benzoquinol methylase